MKKLIVCAYALVFCFISCENDPFPEEKIPELTSYAIRIHIQPQADIESFPETKSISDGIPGEPTTKDSGEEESSLPFSIIEYVVYDLKADTLVHHFSLNKENSEDSEFGVHLYDTLQTGEYRLCFLAHSVQERTFTEERMVTFPEPGDSFYTFKNISVDEYIRDTPVEILLKRKVSRVEFVPKDTLPEDIGTIRIIADGIYNILNMYTGITELSTVPFDKTYQLSKAAEQTSPKQSYGFFTFVPQADQNKINQVNLNTYNDMNEIIRLREIHQIPIYENRITRYTTTLYHPAVSDEDFQIDLEIDEDWDEDIENEITD